MTTRIEGMAAADTFYRHPASLQKTIFFNCFITVMRAARGKSTARWRKGRNELAIESYAQQKKILGDFNYEMQNFIHSYPPSWLVTHDDY